MCLCTDRRVAMFRSFLAPLLLQALFVGHSFAQAGPDTPAKAAVREQMRLQRALFEPPKPAPGGNPVVHAAPAAIPAVVDTNPPRTVAVQPPASQPMPAAPIPSVVDRIREPYVPPMPASRGPLAVSPELDRVPSVSVTPDPPASTQIAPTKDAPSSIPVPLPPRKLKVDL
jgi:hypothetical protein